MSELWPNLFARSDGDSNSAITPVVTVAVSVDSPPIFAGLAGERGNPLRLLDLLRCMYALTYHGHMSLALGLLDGAE